MYNVKSAAGERLARRHAAQGARSCIGRSREPPKRSCNDFAGARTLFAEKSIAARALPISSESCPDRPKPQYWMYNRDGRVTKMEILGNPQAYKDTVRRLFVTCFVFCALVANLSGQQKKRIAVMNFDYATVQSYVQSLFGSN